MNPGAKRTSVEFQSGDLTKCEHDCTKRIWSIDAPLDDAIAAFIEAYRKANRT
jgi:hypothetical protein